MTLQSHTTPSGLSQRAAWAAGQPISDLMHRALAHPELISLAAGFVDQPTLPVEPTRQALDAIFSDPPRARAALQYGTNAGLPSLREAVLQRLQADDGGAHAVDSLSIDQLVITAGSNQFLHLMIDTLFDPGDIMVCGAPTYLVVLGMAANMGVRTLGVETDEDGLLPESIEEQLARLDIAGELARVKAIYVTSYFDNPSTATLALERRGRIVEIAQRWSKHHTIYVIEDAAYRELRYEGDDPPSVRAFDPGGETVIFTHTFSKSYSPGIRVGYGLLPESLVAPVLDQKGNIDFGSPNLAQHIIAKVLELGLFDAHVQSLRNSYRVKRDAMLAAADEFLKPLSEVAWTRPDGGLYIWLQLPEALDSGAEGPLFEKALDEGVLYVPGVHCYPREGVTPRKNMMRLSFGVQTPERIREGIGALARAVEAAT